MAGQWYPPEEREARYAAQKRILEHLHADLVDGDGRAMRAAIYALTEMASPASIEAILDYIQRWSEGGNSGYHTEMIELGYHALAEIYKACEVKRPGEKVNTDDGA